MMIRQQYREDVFIADFTNYINGENSESAPYKGVVVATHDNGIIPSFVLHDENNYPFIVVNNEHNPSVFKRADGTLVSQCECIIYADRNDNRKGWLIFLELKYCKPKNRYENIRDGISQLIATCNYIIKEKKEFDGSMFKKYLVISTPGTEPLDPFDASYFDQDFMLTVKEETGATLKAVNEAFVKTPALVVF